jgi:hypothetical protein
MTANRNSSELSDLLYAMALDEREDRAEVLDEFARAHPEHAAALTDFTIEWAAEALTSRDPKTKCKGTTGTSGISPAVSRALSRFENRLFALGKSAARSGMRSPEVDPFATLDQSAFQAFARQLGCNRVFAMKVRDRVIEPASMPEGFVHCVADLLRIGVDALKRFFAEPPRLARQPQFFKAEGQPSADRRQSYREAVESSGLTDEQQQHLLKL